jgi:hypothetical protein
VRAQCFTPGEAHKAGAIALLRVPLIAEFVELHFGNPREPASKIFAIVEGSEFGDIGKTVVVQVCRSIELRAFRSGFRSVRRQSRRHISGMGQREVTEDQKRWKQ